MSDERKGDVRSWPRVAAICIVLFLLLPIAYVLSAGPVIWCFRHGYLQNDTPGVWLLGYFYAERVASVERMVAQLHGLVYEPVAMSSRSGVCCVRRSPPPVTAQGPS